MTVVPNVYTPSLVRRARRLLVLAAASLAALCVTAAAGSAATGGRALATTASVAPGSLDTGFGSGGFAVAPLGSWVGAAASAVQPDGKVVTAGEALINNRQYMVSSRFNANGSLDPSYGNGGWVVIDVGGASGGNALALQSDGKIVIAGTGYGPNYALDFAAARLLPNGTLDSTFGKGGIATVPVGSYAIAQAVVITTSGQIVLGGGAVVGQKEFAVARLNSNGSIDNTFGTNGVTTFPQAGYAWGMVQQSDGKLVLAGQPGSGSAYLVGRVLANGAVDTSFGQGGVVTIPLGSQAYGDAIALQSDGKLIVAGSAYTNTVVAAAARLLPSGALDPTYGNGGIASVQDYYGVNAATVDGSGRVVLGGVGATAVRFTPSGSIDQTFGRGGLAVATIGSNDAANGVTIDPNSGDVVLSGVTTVYGRTSLSVIKLIG
jgi:uncharacterized delta-60 repeat protein